jgi:hypothetical protein
MRQIYSCLDDDDFLADIKRIIEEADPDATVERFIPLPPPDDDEPKPETIQ